MQQFRVGIIGCGGRGHSHALGYGHTPGTQLAACADSHLPAARALADEYGAENVYTDYREMLAEENLDVVSMALWPELHCAAVLACVDAPHPPKLINAEKPMAPTFGEAVRMHEACEEAGIMLTFSHQRRFGRSFRRGRELIDEGVIGELKRMEMDCSNLLDWATHWFDMMFFYNHDLDADWVMGQIGCVADELVFGARVETAGLSYVKWPNGVTGLVTTGRGTGADCQIRVIGSEGTMTVDHGGVRVLRGEQGWEQAELTLPPVPGEDTTRHIRDSIDCLRAGRASTLCSRNALRATELIFATYESSRRRGRIVLPLRTRDSALLTMLRAGEMEIPDWPAFLTEEEEEQGYRLLFDGKTLRGWQAGPDESWLAEGGMMRGGANAPGLLRTQAVHSDFCLRFEFRLPRSRARGGVVLRGTDRLEIALNDDRLAPLDPETTGALRGFAAPSAQPRVGVTAWCWAEISCQGTRLSVCMRDTEVLSCDLREFSGLENTKQKGWIGFRVHRGCMDIRNVILKPLPESGHER